MRMCALYLSPLTVEDSGAKERFASSVTIDELLVKLGRWQPTEVEKIPPWQWLKNAPLWSSVDLAAKREALTTPRARPTLATTPDPARIRAVDVQVGNQTQCRVLLYKGNQEIPDTAVSCPLGLILLMAPSGSTFRLSQSPHVQRRIDTTPVAVFGTPALARSVAAEVLRLVEERGRTDIECWVRKDDGKLRKHLLILVSPPGHLNADRVCVDHNPSQEERRPDYRHVRVEWASAHCFFIIMLWWGMGICAMRHTKRAVGMGICAMFPVDVHKKNGHLRNVDMVNDFS